MTWTYIGSLSTNKDKVRFLMGDTDSSDQLVSDEEINGVLSMHGDLHLAAAVLLEGLAAKNARKVNAGTGRLQVDASRRMEQYLSMAQVLRNQRDDNAIFDCTIAVGGSTLADVESLDTDSAATQPQFAVGQFDNNTSNPSEDTDDD